MRGIANLTAQHQIQLSCGNRVDAGDGTTHRFCGTANAVFYAFTTNGKSRLQLDSKRQTPVPMEMNWSHHARQAPIVIKVAINQRVTLLCAYILRTSFYGEEPT